MFKPRPRALLPSPWRLHGLTLSSVLSACDPGCRRDSSHREMLPEVPTERPFVPSAQCLREVTHASLGHPSGTGAIDTLSVACDRGILSVFALRGHVLSRLERRTEPGERFSPARVLAQGAHRLGPVGPRALRGPVAFRSPTSDLSPALERDSLGVTMAPSEGSLDPPTLGELTMPAGVHPLGITVALTDSSLHPDALRVMASHASEDSPPEVFVHRVNPRELAPSTLAAMPAPLWEGELDAYDFTRDTALVREGSAQGLSFVVRRRGASPQRFVTPGPMGAVAPRGLNLGDASAFLEGDFRLEDPDGGPCLGLAPGVCIAPGVLSLWVVGDASVRRIELAARGLPDSLTLDTDSSVLVMFVSVNARHEALQRLVRVSVNTSRVTEQSLSPPEGLPAMDHPSLITCGEQVWLVAELSAPEASVTALPLECLLVE